MTDGGNNSGHRHGPQGPLRQMLKLMVEVDSSRFLRTRIGAALALIGLLALFAGLGYAVPAALSRYF